REVRFALLQPEAWSAAATVEPAAIEAWYKAHAEDFAVPESVRLDYAELTLADVAAAVVLPDDKLRERYEKDKARFMQPETRHASHILIAVDDATSDTKAAAQAKEIYDKLKAGGDFAALAKQFSKDSVSAAQGGDLGWAGREVYDKAFADRLFAMQQGEISEPVKTPFGYHIIRLDGIRAEAGRSFEDVRAELSQTMRNELAATEFAQREDQLQERLEQGGTSLDQLTREFGLRRGTVEHFERGAGGLPLGSDAELNRMVFSDSVVGQHRIGGPVQLGEDRLTVFQAQDHKPASVKPLEEVKDGIVSELKREQGSVAALAAAEAAAPRLKAGENFEAVAATLKTKAEPARFVARSAPDVPVELREAAFALPRPVAGKPGVQAIKMEGGAVALLQVTGSRVKELTDNPQLQQLRTQRELQRYSVRDLDAYLAEVMAKSKVRKNPQVFQQ
ncbi:MAG TPA: peptidylprolyl isomerase, partial [Steroidobacteraceae bacterium]|nr:peptidylprolyl isomerase [Steroidobacteraceae bacterium]